jgi:uncharacterized Zn finger protein (UPF0148 family)
MMDKDDVKKASEYLRRGAKLSTEPCPLCGFLLLEMDGKLFCPKCEREVIVAESEEEYTKLSTTLVMNKLKEVILRRIRILTEEVETSPGDTAILELLDRYLTLLDKARNLTE